MLIVKMIFAVLYITGSFIYDHEDDPFMPLLPEESETVAPVEWRHYKKAQILNGHKNEMIYIGVACIVLFRFIDVILFVSIKIWSSKRENFVKKGINPDNSMLNYDDNLIKRYMSSEASMIRDDQN